MRCRSVGAGAVPVVTRETVALNMSRPVKRSFTIGGHRTSISLEAPFWDALKAAAADERVSLSELIGRIDTERGGSGLSGAVRIWLLAYYRNGTRPSGEG